MQQKSSILDNEIKKFDQLSEEWMKYQGKFHSLHLINPLRIQYITEIINKHFDNKSKVKLLDAGCGGGIASIPFARQGLNVTGIDPSENSIKFAQKFIKDNNITANYLSISIEDHLKENKKYDVIICLEMLEHTDKPEMIINNLSQMLAPKGLIFLSTINKTLKAKIFAINLAENILNLVPKNTHSYEYFINPTQLQAMLKKNNLTLKEMKGITYNIVNNQWKLSNDFSINYICYFC